MSKYPNNFGLMREREYDPKDWRAGGVSGAYRTIHREDGDYSDFLPDKELQHGVYFDTMGCVSFSALNCLETIANVKGMKWNKSDRFLAKMSGTSRKGNSLITVARTIRDKGTVPEEEWTWDPTDRIELYDWDDFYATIPEEIKMLGKRWLDDWEIQYEWISMSQIRERLKYGPIQVGVKAWPTPNADGLYTDGGSVSRNHAVMLYKADDTAYYIFDHYDNMYKKLVPTYDFKWAMQFHLNKIDNTKPMPIVDLANDILVQEVTDSGAFGLHLNGKIIVDDVALIQATWLMRNSGMVGNKVKTLTKEQWDSFPKQDLKGNQI